MPVESNKILTDDVIAKKALVLLKNNMVAARLVYRDYEKTFGKVGDTIRLKLPFRTKSASGRTLVKQPLVDQTIAFNINRQEHVGLEYTVKDKTLDIEQFSERYLKSGMIQMANVVDRSILLTMKNSFHTSGTPGVRPGAFIDFANASAKMTTYAVPDDGMRRAVIDPFTCASLSDEVTKLFKESMVEAAYKKGYKGPVSNYETYESQNLPKHTVGDYGGTPLMAAIGTNTNTIATDGWTASKTGLLKVGDVFTISGVYGVNPQSYETTGILQEFVVQLDANSSAGGLSTIKFAPSMNDGTLTTTNEDGDTVSLGAYQNITALPADGAPITVQGAANTTYEQNYLFHRDAIALCVTNLELPRSAVVKERVYDPESGLSILLTQSYDINEMAEVTRIDIVWGTQLIYPELSMRLWGAVSG
tara:strand:- start:3090 stop:4346 length:1257 start_codon:yes stop_codon:yes gene_type:complete